MLYIDVNVYFWFHLHLESKNAIASSEYHFWKRPCSVQTTETISTFISFN